jgi:hypothetical protein
MLVQSRSALLPLSLVIVFTFACTRLLAQGFAADWPATHRNDLSKWAAKTGLAFKSLDKLTKVATEEDAKEGDIWYTIENVDARTFRQQKHILLSTWMAGTGHCMTLYILKRDGSQFEKVWQSYENLCTESILGSAESQAVPDGRIIVRFREHSRTFDPEKEQAPAILSVEITYKWDGASYINAGRKEQPESQVIAR